MVKQILFHTVVQGLQRMEKVTMKYNKKSVFNPPPVEILSVDICWQIFLSRLVVKSSGAI